MEHAGRWKTDEDPLPLLEVYTVAILSFAKAASCLSSECENVPLLLEKLALWVETLGTVVSAKKCLNSCIIFFLILLQGFLTSLESLKSKNLNFRPHIVLDKILIGFKKMITSEHHIWAYMG